MDHIWNFDLCQMDLMSFFSQSNHGYSEMIRWFVELCNHKTRHNVTIYFIIIFIYDIRMKFALKCFLTQQGFFPVNFAIGFIFAILVISSFLRFPPSSSSLANLIRLLFCLYHYYGHFRFKIYIFDLFELKAL